MRNTAAKISQKTFFKKLSGNTKRRYVAQNNCSVAPDSRITILKSLVGLRPNAKMRM